MFTFVRIAYGGFKAHRKNGVKLSIIATAFLIPLCIGGSVYAQKVASSPGSVTLNEGASQLIQLQLDAPIICPIGALTCEVDLSFTSTDPAHVSFSPSTVVWTASQWATTRQVSIQTNDDGIYNNGENVTVRGTATSSSVYYNGFITTIPLTINNIDPKPPEPGIVDKNVSLLENSVATTDVLSGVGNNPDPATLTIVVGPAHGNASKSSNNIIYTPNTDYIGPDSLTYSVCSLFGPSICSNATLNFTVTAPATATLVAAPNTGDGIPHQANSWVTALEISSVVLSLGMIGSGLYVFIRIDRKEATSF